MRIFIILTFQKIQLELADQGGRNGKDMKMMIRKTLCLYNLMGRNRLECLGIDKNIILEWTLRNVLEAALGSAERS
jgi:hypothetical protein